MRPATLVVSAAILATTAPIAGAQDVHGSIAGGRRLAEQWCASCHQLGAGAPAKPGVPTFVQVAQLASSTELALRVFLRTSHADMPNIQLSQADTDDLIAFVLSQKTP